MIYTRAEIVNGTGFSRNVKFFDTQDDLYVLHIAHGDGENYTQSIHASESGAQDELIRFASEYYENTTGEALPDDKGAALRAIDRRVPFDYTIEAYRVLS